MWEIQNYGCMLFNKVNFCFVNENACGAGDCKVLVHLCYHEDVWVTQLSFNRRMPR